MAGQFDLPVVVKVNIELESLLIRVPLTRVRPESTEPRPDFITSVCRREVVWLSGQDHRGIGLDSGLA